MSVRTYKTYSREFKVEAVRLSFESNKPVTQVARELGLRVNQIYKWRKTLEEKKGDAFTKKQEAKDKDAEIRRLKKALAATQEENEFLKNSFVLREEPAVRYAAIQQQRQHYSIRMMCRVLGVSRSGYYDWRDRPSSARAQRHQELTEKIRYFHQASRHTYGAPRIRKDILEGGEQIGENTVALLMKRAGVVPKTIRKFRVTTDSRKTVPAQNLLDRQFKASKPNQRWVSDITFIPTREGWLYLAVIIDLHSRAVIGWAMHKRMKTTLVTDALKMALMRRKVRSRLLLHSDQGSQYASAEYRATLAANSIECSMSRKGNCWDNAVAESFFHTLKTELVHHEDYRSRSEAKASIFEYIEVFYNRQRRHSHIGQVAPLVFENAAAAAN